MTTTLTGCSTIVALCQTNRILVYNNNRTEKESKEENFRERNYADIDISNVFMGVFLLIQCRKTESTLFLERKMKLHQRREVKIERKTTTLSAKTRRYWQITRDLISCDQSNCTNRLVLNKPLFSDNGRYLFFWIVHTARSLSTIKKNLNKQFFPVGNTKCYLDDTFLFLSLENYK